MRFGRGWWLSCLAIAALVVLAGRDASALERKSFLIGFSLGGAEFTREYHDFSDNYGSIALDIDMGASVNQGVAVGLGDYVDTGGNSHYGFGGMVAIGVELARGGRFALDISVRGGLVNEEDYKHKLVSVNLGVNWY